VRQERAAGLIEGVFSSSVVVFFFEILGLIISEDDRGASAEDR
jgi:hypothetical protein